MTITTAQLKDELSLMDNAVEEDILVTKSGEPFMVILGAKRYEELINNQLSEEEKHLNTLKKPRVDWDEKFKERG